MYFALDGFQDFTSSAVPRTAHDLADAIFVKQDSRWIGGLIEAVSNGYQNVAGG
jgi:hypothetical protein